jgi:predicted NBD/HSP70 family sugar kinase
MNVLVIDIGGTYVKILATGQKEHREFESGPKLTPAMMAAAVQNLAKDWNYDVVSIGYPPQENRLCRDNMSVPCGSWYNRFLKQPVSRTRTADKNETQETEDILC